jgi:hypothetical protein
MLIGISTMPDDRRLREDFSIGFLTKVRANSSLSRGVHVRPGGIPILDSYAHPNDVCRTTGTPVSNSTCPNRYRRAFERVVVPKADPPLCATLVLTTLQDFCLARPLNINTAGSQVPYKSPYLIHSISSSISFYR